MAKSEPVKVTLKGTADEVAAMLDWLKDSIDFEQARQSEPDVWGARLYWKLSNSYFEHLAARETPNP